MFLAKALIPLAKAQKRKGSCSLLLLAPISKSVCCEAENNNERVVSLRDSPRGIGHSAKIFDFIPWGRRGTNPRKRREKPLRSPRLCEIYPSLPEIFLYLCN